MTASALGESHIANVVHVVGDGDEALEYLRRQGRHGSASRPDLIILDLNLPRRDGREVLAEIKTDDDLKAIPVVVLTTSSADADISMSYQMHVNCYVTKAVDYDESVRTIRGLEDFWLSLACFPGGVGA
jgi:chemotaxis family two-component system response regulator Rcp1